MVLIPRQTQTTGRRSPGQSSGLPVAEGRSSDSCGDLGNPTSPGIGSVPSSSPRPAAHAPQTTTTPGPLSTPRHGPDRRQATPVAVPGGVAGDRQPVRPGRTCNGLPAGQAGRRLTDVVGQLVDAAAAGERGDRRMPRPASGSGPEDGIGLASSGFFASADVRVTVRVKALADHGHMSHATQHPAIAVTHRQPAAPDHGRHAPNRPQNHPAGTVRRQDDSRYGQRTGAHTVAGTAERYLQDTPERPQTPLPLRSVTRLGGDPLAVRMRKRSSRTTRVVATSTFARRPRDDFATTRDMLSALKLSRPLAGKTPRNRPIATTATTKSHN